MVVGENGMSAAADPYELLGVSPEAGPDEIRRAYHHEAVRCHPDTFPGDPAKAIKRFQKVNRAYETLMRPYQPAMKPEEFARLDVGWLLSRQEATRTPWVKAWPKTCETVEVSRPTHDEPTIFVLIWSLALALGMTVGYCSLKLWLGVVIYLAVVLGGYRVLLLTREVVRLTIRLTLGIYRALPPPGAATR